MSTRFCAIEKCTNPPMPHSIKCSYHIAESLRKPAEMICTDHWCKKHQANTGEGDICGQCEAEADQLIARINFCIVNYGGVLRVKSTDYAFKVPVYSFNDAKRVFHTLNYNAVESCALHYTDGMLDKVHKFK